MEGSKGMARDRARASSTDGKGDAARSDAARITISVFGSALTVAVALAALILTSANYTREQFHDQNEIMRRHFTEQNEQMRRHFTGQLDLMRRHFTGQNEQMRRHFTGQLDLMRAHFDSRLDLMQAHSDSQFEQVREDVRGVRGDLEEVRENVRALAERQAKVEGLLLAVHRTGVVAPSEPQSAHSSLSHPGGPASE